MAKKRMPPEPSPQVPARKPKPKPTPASSIRLPLPLDLDDEEKTMLRELMQKLGSKGGKVAAARLTPEELSERNRKAIQARWSKYKKGTR